MPNSVANYAKVCQNITNIAKNPDCYLQMGAKMSNDKNSEWLKWRDSKLSTVKTQKGQYYERLLSTHKNQEHKDVERNLNRKQI